MRWCWMACTGHAVYSVAPEDGKARPTVKYGWRCTPPMNWFGHGWQSLDGYQVIIILL